MTDVNDEVAQAERQEHLEAARESLGVGEHVDPLDALLSIGADGGQETEDLPVTLRDGVSTVFTIRSLKAKELDSIRKSCTKRVRHGRGPRVPELDEQTMYSMLVAECTLNPLFADARLMSAAGAREPHEAVNHFLKPGTIDGLSSRILEISGYTDELLDAGKD